MCGITGFTHLNAPPSGVIQRATKTLHHRGPDEWNVFESPRVSLGSVRLKILDLVGGQQPMGGDSGCVLAFNGEIYNHAELRRELEVLGHRFYSNCDTEVVLRAFEQWDTGCFKRLRGMFAAAFWQDRENRLILVRDRLGIKPLYYTAQRGQIYFGSELKALFEHPQVPRVLSMNALGHFLSLNYVPGPATLVAEVYKVAPATWLEWRDGSITHHHYWQNRMQPAEISKHDAQAELDALLISAIQEHLMADVPVGVWLSGGLDSSTILHYAAHASRTPLRTFSISFRGRHCDESQFSRPLAAHYGARHEELDLNSDLDLTSAIHALSYYSDEPSADAGAIPVWFLSRITARSVRVALSGEGADELFGGYQTYQADRYAQWARRVPRSILKVALSCAGLLRASDRKIGFEYKLKRFLAGALLPADEAHFFWNGAFSESERESLGFDWPCPPLNSLLAHLPFLPAQQDPNRYLFVDQHLYLPDDILYKCDRVSMAHSLEVRPPFLDHRLVEFAARLPHHLKIQRGETKVLLRSLMRNKLPPGCINPRKEGLDIPAHDWLRGPLRSFLLESLSQQAVESVGLFSYRSIQRLIEAHCTKRANFGYHLWGLITLHLWIRRWNIRMPAEQFRQSSAVSAAMAG